jgi:hypothetical protein
MSAQILSPQLYIEELVAQILMERKVTSTEQQILMCALLYADELDETERTLIDRVLYGVRHGLLRIVE